MLESQRLGSRGAAPGTVMADGAATQCLCWCFDVGDDQWARMRAWVVLEVCSRLRECAQRLGVGSVGVKIFAAGERLEKRSLGLWGFGPGR